MSITIVGLGPGNPDLLTLAAHRTLRSAKKIYLRTTIHPTVAAIDPDIPTESFDELYENESEFEGVYRRIVDRLLAAAGTGDVVYAVPGHPLVGEKTVQILIEEAPHRGVKLIFVEGLSYIEPALTALGLDPFSSGLQVLDALDFRIDTRTPALIGQIYGARIAAHLKLALLEQYPPDHEVTVLRHAGLEEQSTRTIELYTLDRTEDIDHLTCLYVPPIPELEDIGSHHTLKTVVERLRRDCPWDREQTHVSLRPYFIEETYEALDALDGEDLARFSEELGDVLLQIHLHSAIAEEAGEFTLRDVQAAITRKLIKRHPHVFGELQANSAEEVEANWQRLKRDERSEEASMLDGVPKAMPALSQVQTIQRRAVQVGFEWKSIDGAWLKLAEELGELRTARGYDQQLWELGDVLFVLVDLARWMGIEAEDALKSAAARFRKRFGWMEAESRAQGRALENFALDELLDLWQRSKPVVAAGAKAG